MTVSTDMLATWRHPRVIFRRHMAWGVSEPFAFTLLLMFLILTAIGQWPVAARDAFLAGEPSAAPRMFARALAVFALIPFWYVLAALGRLVARAMGGQGTWYTARLALFWALATVSPLMLLQGLVAGMIGAGPALVLVTSFAGAGVLWLWLTMLHEAERG